MTGYLLAAKIVGMNAVLTFAMRIRFGILRTSICPSGWPFSFNPKKVIEREVFSVEALQQEALIIWSEFPIFVVTPPLEKTQSIRRLNCSTCSVALAEKRTSS